jgi:hypothetical protein
VLDLPAGGKVTLEIACHVGKLSCSSLILVYSPPTGRSLLIAWTSYGWATTEVGSEYDAYAFFFPFSVLSSISLIRLFLY